MTSGVNFNDMSGNFDYNSGVNHEKSFYGVEDGLYKYYIKCRNSSMDNSFNPTELEFDLRVDLLVSGAIDLSPESPLKSGKVDVSLITTKTISQNPQLSYSFDGVVYNKIPLFGNQQNWKGYFIIPDSIGDAIGSFKLSATDLEGRTGELITDGGVFIVDTTKPQTISYLNAVGSQGQIRVDWHYDDSDISKFKIYRSNSPNSDYSNFYTTVSTSPFLDNMVEKGKTYYYRVTGVDSAGNEGELSREVYATALIDSSSSTTNSGLDINLVGGVDSFIGDIDSLSSDIDNIASSISSKSAVEKDLYSSLGYTKEANNAKSKLTSLKSDVLQYKLQDLTKAELDSKISSSKLKLDIIRKSVPEDIVITLQDSRTESIQRADIESSLLLLNSSISDIEKETDTTDSLKMIKDSGLSIQSNFYVCDIVYLDGTKKEISVVERDINSQLEKSENASFYEFIPKELAESASLINVANLGYRVIQEDPVISFGLDNKKIFYSFDKASTLSSLRDIKIVLISLSASNEKSNSILTGYSILFNLTNQGYSWVIIIVIFILLGLFIYFIIIKKKKHSQSFIDLDRDCDEAFNLLKNGDVKKAEEIYKTLNENYKKLDKKEKERAFPILDSLRNKILIFNIEEKINILENNKDLQAFESLKLIYNDLSEEYKKKVSKSFEKIKGDFENAK